MASSFLLFLLLLLSTDIISMMKPTTCEKVSVGLYYESMCPDSARFIVNSLAMIFSDDLIDIVDLNLVPWGNAQLYYDTFKCQHGSYECLLNTVEACAIDAWPDVNDHFPFIYCVESLVCKHNYTYWETCFEKLGLDNASAVAECYTSAHGKELELGYAAQTNALQPPHTFVPWVVVQGEPLYDDSENLASYICEAYKGIAKPSACGGESYVEF